MKCSKHCRQCGLFFLCVILGGGIMPAANAMVQVVNSYGEAVSVAYNSGEGDAFGCFSGKSHQLLQSGSSFYPQPAQGEGLNICSVVSGNVTLCAEQPFYQAYCNVGDGGIVFINSNGSCNCGY